MHIHEAVHCHLRHGTTVMASKHQSAIMSRGETFTKIKHKSRVHEHIYEHIYVSSSNVTYHILDIKTYSAPVKNWKPLAEGQRQDQTQGLNTEIEAGKGFLCSIATQLYTCGSSC